MDSEKPRSLGSIATRIVCTLFGLLLLYVLSIGPAAYLYSRKKLSYSHLMKLSAPLFWATDNTPLVRPLQAYVDWWDKRAGGTGSSSSLEPPPITPPAPP